MFEVGVSRRQLPGHLMWFLVWVAVTAVGWVLSPSRAGHGTHQQLGLAPCPSVIFFHRPCPGCGLTTSFAATIHGDLPLAFRAHALGPLLYGIFTATAFACFYGWIRQHRMRSETPAFNWMIGCVIGVFLAYGAVRFALTPDFQIVWPERTVYGR